MRPIDADSLEKRFEYLENFGNKLSHKVTDEEKGKRIAYHLAKYETHVAPTIVDTGSLCLQWIPVAERLPDNASHPGALCTRCMVMTKYGVTEGWYNPDRESWFLLFWFMTERILEHEINFVGGDVPRVVKVPLHNRIVSAWMPLPEPYEPMEDHNV